MRIRKLIALPLVTAITLGGLAVTVSAAAAAGHGCEPTVSYANLNGTNASKRINRAGDRTVGLPDGNLDIRDFRDGQNSKKKGASNYGMLLTAGGIAGQGQSDTTVRMLPNTSTKAAAVPGNRGKLRGGPKNPTNNMYLVSMTHDAAAVCDLTIAGTPQGHLYNGLRFQHVKGGTIENVTVKQIPGKSNGNPGETFAVNLNHTSGTTNVRNLNVDGGNIAAAGLATNSASGTLNIDGLRTENLRYSAGLATWQQQGTVNIRNWVSTTSPRSLGAERLAGTINLYDPQWLDRKSHDITYTPWAGHRMGRINFYFSDVNKLPSRKIVIYTNTAKVKGSVHVYVNGQEQPQGRYIHWE